MANRSPSLLGILGGFLLRPFVFFLRWFGYGPPSLTYEPPPLRVYVKIIDGSETLTVPVDLRKEWTIGHVKEYLASGLSKSATGFRIILAGKELTNNVRISDCDLGPQTVIHAIIVLYENAEENSQVPTASDAPMNASLKDLQLNPDEQVEGEGTPDHPAFFYVYCDSASCRHIVPQPGKLRVRCANCHEGAILVLSDPCSWDDVLYPRKIQGYCQNNKCVHSDTELGDNPRLVDVEFFFKCHGPQHKTDDLGEDMTEASPLYLIRPNIRQIPCLSCGDTPSEKETVLVFECADRHVICVDCFKLYCTSRLNERQFILDENLGYTLGCPVGCDNSLIRQLKHFKVLSSHHYERYQRFATEESVFKSGGVLCPQPGCGMGIITDDRRIVCSNCQYVFCKNCLHGFHIGDCNTDLNTSDTEDRRFEMDVQRVSRARWVDIVDPSSVIAIQLTTKPCPKCRTPTERSGGCMHMSCTKAGCGFQWCWVCQTEWSRECMGNHWFG